jgi:hypothetical protein
MHLVPVWGILEADAGEETQVRAAIYARYSSQMHCAASIEDQVGNCRRRAIQTLVDRRPSLQLPAAPRNCLGAPRQAARARRRRPTEAPFVAAEQAIDNSTARAAIQTPRDQKAGAIRLDEPSRRRLLTYLLGQNAVRVAQASEGAFAGLISTWMDTEHDPAALAAGCGAAQRFNVHAASVY